MRAAQRRRDLGLLLGRALPLLLLCGCQLMMGDYTYRDATGRDVGRDAGHDTGGSAERDGAVVDAMVPDSSPSPDRVAQPDRTALDAGSVRDTGSVNDAPAWDAAALMMLDPVQDLYPGLGAWNDYLQRDADHDWYSQLCTDGCTPCETVEARSMPGDCIHGGEKKVVEIPGVMVCGDLRARDDLGLFSWECQEQTFAIRFVSQGLKPEHGLRDLLEYVYAIPRWRSNAVTIFDAQDRPVARTEATSWWTNPIYELRGDEGGGLGEPSFSPGTIFVVPQHDETSGLGLHLDRAALVTLPGVVLRYSGADRGDCDPDTGAVGGPPSDPPLNCVLSAHDAAFLWIEVAIDARSLSGGQADRGLNLNDVVHARVRNTSVISSSSSNLQLAQVRSSLFFDITLANAHGSPTTANAAGDSSSSHNLFHSVRSSNSAGYGMVLYGEHNVVLHGLFTNNGWSGLILVNPATVSHVTAVNNALDGVGIGLNREADNGAVVQLVSANNGDRGLSASLAGEITFANIVLAYNSGGPLTLADATLASFHGHLIVDGLCDIDTATSPGITEECLPLSPPSDHHLNSLVDPELPFVAEIPEGDLTNRDSTHGPTAYEAIEDWTRFDSWYRAWGKSTGAVPRFPVDDSWGACLIADQCRVWDWRYFYEAGLLWNRSGEGLLTNTALELGQECPAAVHGDRAVESVHGTFLINALEVMLDSQGDEDGLCESDERCLFSPNLGGAYQGEPVSMLERIGPCSFVDGVVAGVTMFGRPTNGVE